MGTPYRRRPSPVRTLWTYRYLFAAAFVLGVLLWFVLINNDPVIVSFPFGLGRLESRSGILILLSSLVGAMAGALGVGVGLTVHRLKSRASNADDGDQAILPDDRPPTDYASKAPEGFDQARWSAPPDRPGK